MKVGIVLPQVGQNATRENILYVAKEAEKSGLDSVWTIDRLLWPLKPQTPYPVTPDGSLPTEYQHVLDPLETLTFLAAHTERISLGTCVVDMPYYTPVNLARRFTTLDILSTGRAIAGLGLGWSKDEYDTSNTPYSQRGARADEFVEALRKIWTEEVVEFNGNFYKIPASKIAPKPLQKPHPPILLGGFTPGTLERIVKYADGWIAVAGFGPLDQLAQTIKGLREAARKAGRDPSKVFVLAYPYLVDSKDNRSPMSGNIDQIGSDVAQIKEMGAEHIIFGYLFSPLGSDLKKMMDVTVQLAKFAR